jgi:hypothetical protein
MVITSRKLSQMAIPPARGMAVEWIRRSPGSSINPSRGATANMTRFNPRDTATARPATTAILIQITFTLKDS